MKCAPLWRGANTLPLSLAGRGRGEGRRTPAQHWHSSPPRTARSSSKTPEIVPIRAIIDPLRAPSPSPRDVCLTENGCFTIVPLTLVAQWHSSLASLCSGLTLSLRGRERRRREEPRKRHFDRALPGIAPDLAVRMDLCYTGPAQQRAEAGGAGGARRLPHKTLAERRGRERLCPLRRVAGSGPPSRGRGRSTINADKPAKARGQKASRVPDSWSLVADRHVR